MEKLKIDTFRNTRMREIRNKRADNKIRKIKIGIFFTVFTVCNFFLMVYILDNLL